jgi:hypothetical protein
VPEIVIDRLEVIQVDEHNRDALVGSRCAGECLSEPVVKQPPIGKPGERIEICLLCQYPLEALAGHRATDRAA